jgi:hypothetical protein|uniref:Uncharacterized protein n=1 Tax=Siphoviridae sp. ctJ3t72 TaxID=2826240 RepID=A0A8S5QMZ5_9CAUD|nr:MAG TPA: hypothetical protein [Siphoviridae sp. ctJ3t72]
MDINAFLKNEEALSAKELIKLTSTAKGRENIKSVRFVIPKIGKSRDFGYFKVSYKTPYYSSVR